MSNIGISRNFIAPHPKAANKKLSKEAEATYFVEQILNATGIDYRDSSYLAKVMTWNIDKIDSGKLTYEQIREFIGSLNPEIKTKKIHTIRASERVKVGTKIQLFCWSDKPYNSPQICFCPPFICPKVEEITIATDGEDYAIFIDTKFKNKETEIANNDGLSLADFLAWFNIPFKDFKGNIIHFIK